MAAVERLPADEPNTSRRAAVVAAGERWSSGQRRLVHLIAELDTSGEWATDGAATCAHWVAAALECLPPESGCESGIFSRGWT